MRRVTPSFVENNERNIAIWTEMQVGGMGFDIINDTNFHTGNYYEIIPLSTTATVASATFYPGYSGSPLLSAVPLPQGLRFKADFTGIKLSSGSVVGYYLY